MNRSSFSISKSAKTSSQTSSKTSRSALKKLELIQQNPQTEPVVKQSILERMVLLEKGRQNDENVSRAQHNRQSKQCQFDMFYGDAN